MKPLCIYHGNCADGFGAAWVVWKHFGGEVDFHAGVYQKPPPDVKDRDVIIVDFSYKRHALSGMASEAKSILVLDHHKTAAEDLEAAGRFIQLANQADYHDFLRSVEEDHADRIETQIYTVFDMERSGAGITWDFFNPGNPRPRLIDHLEDRDLWRFKLPKTREIQASMFSLPYEFDLWDDRIQGVENNRGLLNDYIEEGAAIERKHFKDIEELVQIVTRPMKFKTRSHPTDTATYSYIIVPTANLPYTMVSDAGHLLCERNWYGLTAMQEAERPDARTSLRYSHLFAACYYDGSDGRNFSLRSRDDGADVGAIAKLYGGGGHPHAAGFRVPFEQLTEFEP